MSGRRYKRLGKGSFFGELVYVNSRPNLTTHVRVMFTTHVHVMFTTRD